MKKRFLIGTSFLLIGVLSSCFVSTSVYHDCNWGDAGPSQKTKPNYDKERFFLSNYTYSTRYGGHAGNGDLNKGFKSSLYKPKRSKMNKPCLEPANSYFCFCDAISGYRSFSTEDPNGCFFNIMIANISVHPDDWANTSDGSNISLKNLRALRANVADDSGVYLYEQDIAIDTNLLNVKAISKFTEWVREDDFPFSIRLHLYDLFSFDIDHLSRTYKLSINYEFNLSDSVFLKSAKSTYSFTVVKTQKNIDINKISLEFEFGYRE